MFGHSFKASKCETTCKLCLGRIQLMRTKKTMQINQSRRTVADMLTNNKIESARIRVEAVIREQLVLQAFEILELYLELLSVRAHLISKTKEIPRDCMEAISSIVYSAQKLSDVPELENLRVMLAAKYGGAYVKEAAADSSCDKWQVNENLRRCLTVEPPPPEEKLQELLAIVRDFGVQNVDLGALASSILPYPVVGVMAGARRGGSVDEHDAAANDYPPADYARFSAQANQPRRPNQLCVVQHPAGSSQPPAAQQIPPAVQYRSQEVNFPVNFAPQSGISQDKGDGSGVAQSTQQAAQQAPLPSMYPPEHVSVNFTIKTDDEIRRAYDEAQGPPAKPDLVPSAPPLPPISSPLPPTSSPHPPISSHLPPTSSLFPPDLQPDFPSPPPHLPSPPGPHTHRHAPASSQNLPSPSPPGDIAPAPPLDEYELLTQRLEALKRS